jgi:hypothetical protein
MRKELFYITNPDNQIKPEEVEEKYYWKLLKDHCNSTSKQRYIG